MQRAQAAQLAKQDATRPKPVATGAAGAARAEDQGDNAFILDIVEPPKVRENQTPCPSCGKGVNEGHVLCTSCGFNLKTGERALVSVLKPVELKDKTERNRSGGGGGMNIPEWAIGVTAMVIFGGLMGFGFATENPLLFVLGGAGAGLYGIVTFITVVVTAFKEDDATAGILMLCSILCPILSLYMLYWVLVKCDTAVVKWMYAASLLLSITMFGMNMANPELLQAAN